MPSTRVFQRSTAVGLAGAVCLAVLSGAWQSAPNPAPAAAEKESAWSSEVAAASAIDLAVRQSWPADLVALPRADDLLVARRLALALVGTVPSLEEIRWLESQPDEGRIERWVDRLLSDRRCADHLAERFRNWLVPAVTDAFLIYRERRFTTWLSDQIVANRPYDELVGELLTSEGLWTSQPATNFLTSHNVDPARLAARSTRAFLGLRIDCAECHDHPFSPRWKQAHFRGIAAYFGQASLGFPFGLREDGNKEFEIEDPGSKVKEVIPCALPLLDGLESTTPESNRREALARWITHPDNPFFGPAIANRFWGLLFGRPLVEPVDDLEAAERVPGVLTLLADDFRGHGHDLKRMVRVIASTEAFRRASGAQGPATSPQEDLHAAFPITRLRPDQLARSLFQISRLHTVDHQSHWLVRLGSFFHENEFVAGYGEAGEDELAPRDGNIPQRLVMMNGKAVGERIGAAPFNTALRLSRLASTGDRCIEVAYLVVLTRRPTPAEREWFLDRLAGRQGDERDREVEDMLWALVNSTEFAWNR